MSGNLRPYATFDPPENCQACRLGEFTVPCEPNDVRGYITGSGKWEKLYRLNVVRGEGVVGATSRIMCIGEAPGFQEDRDGLPFRPTAPAGRVLQEALKRTNICRIVTIGSVAGVSLWRCSTHDYDPSKPETHPGPLTAGWFTNALKCRPEDNKITRFPDALETCRDRYLMDEMAAVRPDVVVCLGKVAAAPWFGDTSSLAFRQTTLPGEIYPCLFIHAPHPSNIARGAADNRPKLEEALRVARQVAYPNA